MCRLLSNFEFVCAELISKKVAEAHEALLREFDDERLHHQKMMSDYARLQQRFDNLQVDRASNTDVVDGVYGGPIAP